MTGLSAQIKKYAKQLGADAVGIASAERFAPAPEGHKPTDLLESARSVVAFGIRNLPAVVDSSPSYVYSKIGYYFLNRYLDRIAYELARFLDDQGWAVLPVGAMQALRLVTSSTPQGQQERFMGVLSLKHSAEQAGLGRIGRSNLLITPQYGPRVRLGALLTSAPLVADPLLDNPVCYPKCRLCVKACPTGAISEQGHLDHIQCFMEKEDRAELNRKRLEGIRNAAKGDLTAYDARAVSAADYVGRSCGLHCLKACPVGKKKRS